jgi:hypothetical protein
MEICTAKYSIFMRASLTFQQLATYPESSSVGRGRVARWLEQRGKLGMDRQLYRQSKLVTIFG